MQNNQKSLNRLTAAIKAMPSVSDRIAARFSPTQADSKPRPVVGKGNPKAVARRRAKNKTAKASRKANR